MEILLVTLIVLMIANLLLKLNEKYEIKIIKQKPTRVNVNAVRNINRQFTRTPFGMRTQL